MTRTMEQIEQARLHAEAVADARDKKQKALAKQHKIAVEQFGGKEGTPETLYHASRTRQGNIAGLFMAGKIDQEQVGWAEEIYRAYEVVASDVSIRNVSYEPRIDNQASARNVLVEGIGRIRREVAYTYWRRNIPAPQAMIMEMLTGERISYSTAAIKYKMGKPKSLGLLIKAIDLWPTAVDQAVKNVDAADVAAAHAGLI